MLAQVVKLLRSGGIQATIEFDTITVPIGGTTVLRAYRLNRHWVAGAYDGSQVAMTETELPERDVPSDSANAEQIAVYVMRCLFRFGHQYSKGLVPQYVKK